MRGNKLDPSKQRVLLDLDRELVRRIDHIAVDWDDYRKDAIARLLQIAVDKVEEEKQGARRTA